LGRHLSAGKTSVLCFERHKSSASRTIFERCMSRP
jgi:hypothetical protein